MLKLSKKELTTLCGQAERKLGASKQLDISNNCLTDVEGIDVWQDDLKWLNASHNQIKSIKHLKSCSKINVLNLSHNKISSLKNLNKLKSLNALILNNNNLESLDGISSLLELNTLVISSNSLEKVDVTSLTKLQKLSISHNGLKEFPLVLSQKGLRDLKLNNNNIQHIPEWFATSCKQIKVLDLGNNGFKDIESIECLNQLPFLENLNLKGNELCNVEDYHIKMKELFPKLRILDFKKLSELFFKAVELKSKSKDTPAVSDKKKDIPAVLEERKDIPAVLDEKKKHVQAERTDIPALSGDGKKSCEIVSDSHEKLSKVANKMSNLKDDVINTDVTNGHGFMKEAVKENCLELENDLSVDVDDKLEDEKETKEAKKVKKRKRKLRDENEQKSLEGESVQSTKIKKKKKKERPLAEDQFDSKSIENKPEQRNEGNTVITQKKKKKKKKKGKEELNKSGKKSSKTTGIVNITKASSKKQTTFNPSDLQDNFSSSFGSGENLGWS